MLFFWSADTTHFFAASDTPFAFTTSTPSATPAARTRNWSSSVPEDPVRPPASSMQALSYFVCFSRAASALGTSPLVNFGSEISIDTGTPAAGAADALATGGTEADAAAEAVSAGAEAD